MGERLAADWVHVESPTCLHLLAGKKTKSSGPARNSSDEIGRRAGRLARGVAKPTRVKHSGANNSAGIRFEGFKPSLIVPI